MCVAVCTVLEAQLTFRAAVGIAELLPRVVKARCCGRRALCVLLAGLAVLRTSWIKEFADQRMRPLFRRGHPGGELSGSVCVTVVCCGGDFTDAKRWEDGMRYFVAGAYLAVLYL